MATLTNCPTCKKQVSSEAATCPHCGEVLNSNKSTTSFNMGDPVHVIGIIVALIILGLIIAAAAKS